MIKNILKNKKTMGFIVAALIISIGLGATYAWWVIRTETQINLQMGELKISAEIDNTPLNFYEPGDKCINEGEISNTGSVAAILRLDKKVEINFNDGLGYVTDTDHAVDMTLENLSIPDFPTANIGITEDGSIRWALLQSLDNEEDKFILLMPGYSIDISIKSELIGDVMGINYQKAGIRLSNDIKATQTYDGAMMAEFGLKYEDLEIVPITGLMRHAAVTKDVMAQLRTIFHQ